jgi:hypothetical protein
VTNSSSELTNYYPSNDFYPSQNLHQDRNQSVLVVRQGVGRCGVDVVVEEERQEEEVDLAAIVDVVVSVEEEARQEEEDLELEVVVEDSAEVRLEGADSVRRVVVSAAVEELDQLHRCRISRRLGNGHGVVGILVSAGQTIPGVYEKGYVVSKLDGDECRSLVIFLDISSIL